MSIFLTDEQKSAMWAEIDAAETEDELDAAMVRYWVLGWLEVPAKLSAKRKKLLDKVLEERDGTGSI